MAEYLLDLNFIMVLKLYSFRLLHFTTSYG